MTQCSSKVSGGFVKAKYAPLRCDLEEGHDGDHEFDYGDRILVAHWLNEAAE